MKNVKQGDKKRNISIIIIASIVALIIIVSIFAFYFFKIEFFPFQKSFWKGLGKPFFKKVF